MPGYVAVPNRAETHSSSDDFHMFWEMQRDKVLNMRPGGRGKTIQSVSNLIAGILWRLTEATAASAMILDRRFLRRISETAGILIYGRETGIPRKNRTAGS